MFGGDQGGEGDWEGRQKKLVVRNSENCQWVGKQLTDTAGAHPLV